MGISLVVGRQILDLKALVRAQDPQPPKLLNISNVTRTESLSNECILERTQIRTTANP